MANIASIFARRILDSRGNPTIETKVALDDDSVGVSSIPSGASTGSFEALELRDTTSKLYGGLDVSQAINNVNQTISQKLINQNALNQENIDKIMIDLDGTENKESLGANATLSVSEAVCRAAANSRKQPLYQYINLLLGSNIPLSLPTPMFNIVNGGKHGGMGNLDFQEFMIVPEKNIPYHEALRMGVEIYHNLKTLLKLRGATTVIGDEGGFAPNFNSNKEVLAILTEAIKNSGYEPGVQAFISLDIAATHIKKGDTYQIKDSTTPLNSDLLINFYKDLRQEFPVLSIEDPFSEDDWENWTKMVKEVDGSLLVIADDLVATNQKRFSYCLSQGAATGVIVKPNQIGTITETLEVVRMAKQANVATVVSHRSGETNDSFIADLAVGVGSLYIKAGAPARGERVAKYNRLLEIEEELSKS
ncbi:MAG: phosphopyruvate hydratase [Patescibacteria group bacterium]|nr:phosphopyruvate hydratase [Patescibacteria group bacterium]